REPLPGAIVDLAQIVENLGLDAERRGERRRGRARPSLRAAIDAGEAVLAVGGGEGLGHRDAVGSQVALRARAAEEMRLARLGLPVAKKEEGERHATSLRRDR